MKKIKLILISVLFAFTLISCSSDEEEPENPSGQNKLVQSEIISADRKVEYQYNIDKLLSRQIGTFPNFGYIADYVYDSDSRITEWTFQENGSSNYSDTQNYTYDGQGQLTSYSAKTENVTLTYNNSSITATGKIQGYQDVQILLKINSSGLIIKSTESHNYTTFAYDSNGNMTSIIRFDNNNNQLSLFNITYDNKVNPFKGQFESIYIERFIEFFYDFDGYFVSGFEGYSFPFFTNNILTFSKNKEIDLSYTYTYDIDNYPTSVHINSPSGTIDYTVKY